MSAWVWPAAIGVIFVAAALLYFFVPSVQYQLGQASSIIRSESPTSIKMYVNVQYGRSPLAIIGLSALQVLLAPLKADALVTASYEMFGLVLGTAAVWVGITLGSLLAFAIMRGLCAPFLRRKRHQTGANDAPASASDISLASSARLALIGLRLMPGIPQDYLSYALGFTRIRFVDVLWSSALTATITTVLALTSSTVLFWVLTLAGLALLCVYGWAQRGRIPTGTISPEQLRKAAVFAVVVLILVGVYLGVPGVKIWVDTSVAKISGNPSGVAAYLRSFGIIGPIVSMILMVLQSIAAPLPAFVITFANGMVWGFLGGAALSWSGAMAGAALSFWIARILGRPAVEKLVGGSGALQVSDRFFERYGDRTILIARLLPFVSFDIISYGAGLTSISFWKFFIATGIGQLPATLVYSYLASVGGAATSVKILLYVFIATAVLLVLATSLRPWFMRRFESNEAPEEPNSSTNK